MIVAKIKTFVSIRLIFTKTKAVFQKDMLNQIIVVQGGWSKMSIDFASFISSLLWILICLGCAYLFWEFLGYLNKVKGGN